MHQGRKSGQELDEQPVADKQVLNPDDYDLLADIVTFSIDLSYLLWRAVSPA